MPSLPTTLANLLDDIAQDAEFSSDLVSDLLDRKGEELFVRAVYHKARRRGIPVERERQRRDLTINGEGIEVKVISPWTVMRASDGRKDRSFDDFIHSKDLAALKSGGVQWLAAVVVHPLDRPHRQYPTRSHPGIISVKDLGKVIPAEAKTWADRNGVVLRKRLAKVFTDTVPGSDNGTVHVNVYLFAAT